MPEKLLDFRSDTVTRPTPGMRPPWPRPMWATTFSATTPPSTGSSAASPRCSARRRPSSFPPARCPTRSACACTASRETRSSARPAATSTTTSRAAYAQLSGVAVRTVAGDRGVMTVEQLEGLIRPDNAHYVRTRLVTIENTHNRGGGRIQPYPVVEAVCRWAHEHGLRTHLDGARLWNAVVASGIELARWTQHFDTASVCFSKGLGAPVGSAICGPRELIAEGLRHRKVLGGGMRQAGILAAAALYALDHHIDRLAEDHANARRLAEGICRIPRLRLDPETVDTNILFFCVDPAWGTAGEFVAELKKRGVLMLAESDARIRALTHLDVNSADVDAALEAVRAVMGGAK